MGVGWLDSCGSGLSNGSICVSVALFLSEICPPSLKPLVLCNNKSDVSD